MPESLEEIATCALYEPTAQREAVLAREIIAHGKRLDALESAGASDGVTVDDVIEHYTVTEDAWRRQCRDLQQQLDEGRAALATERALADRLAEDLRLTQEYVGDGLLPALAGWTWFDGLTAWKQQRAATALAAPTPTAGGS